MSVPTSESVASCTLRSSDADGFFYLNPQNGSVGQCETLGIGWTQLATNPQLLGKSRCFRSWATKLAKERLNVRQEMLRLTIEIEL